MAKENPDSGNELRKLYLSFTKAVEEGDDLMEFSSDDLLDVFDYALRGADEYIAGEAMIEGLRRAPGDGDFIKRKGFLFHEIDNDEACERIFRELPETEFVRVALALRDAAELPEAAADEFFRKALAMVGSSTVEEWDIVFLVDIFDTIDKIDLLMRHGDEIARVSQIPECIFSELYNLFYEKGRYSEALEVGKKLCDLNAFDVEAWTELANLYLMKFGDAESAIECAEYAIAIEPDNLTALMLSVIALHGSDPKQARDIVSSTLRKHPDEPMVLFAAGCIDFMDDNEPRGLERINESFTGFNKIQRREAMDLALRNIKDIDNSPEVIRNLGIMLNDDREINCAEWLENLIRMGAYCGALCLATASLEARTLDLSILSVVTNICESIYRMGQYEELKGFVEDLYPNEESRLEDMPAVMMLIYAIALYRLGEISELKRFLNDAIKTTAVTPRGILVQENIFLRANNRMLTLMRRELDKLPTPPDESLFDPFK
ncbi:MAG: hypothetical protein HDS07_03790 [Bacteroides sp.]|nr:hypothetical protein [Bacteroides sp.]